MRLLTLAPLLAVSAFAAEASSSKASSAAESSSSSEPEPEPLGKTWSPKWTTSSLIPYKVSCSSTSTYTASIYKLSELYPDLKEAAPELKVFYNKQHYPGSWDGEDKHGNDRELLKMGYEELPFAVREWMRDHPKQRRIATWDGEVFFAPGAIYPIAPLWVDESDEAECEGSFEDISDYSAEVKDGAILGSVQHKNTGKNEVLFTVEAFKVKKNADAEEAGDEAAEEKDEL